MPASTSSVVVQFLFGVAVVRWCRGCFRHPTHASRILPALNREHNHAPHASHPKLGSTKPEHDAEALNPTLHREPSSPNPKACLKVMFSFQGSVGRLVELSGNSSDLYRHSERKKADKKVPKPGSLYRNIYTPNQKS